MNGVSEKLGHKAVAANLFRHESARLVASLTRIFGPQNLDLAEDVVQDALVSALQAWKFEIPENPAAWLSRVARNRAIDLVRKQSSHRKFAEEHAAQLSSSLTLSTTVEGSFEQPNSDENLLRMMITLCHPKLSTETHITLILKFLCGFSARELAETFLTKTETINKRLQRGRAQLRDLGSLLSIAEASKGSPSIKSVLNALYLLFNEGYHGSHPSTPTRSVLCEEAMRLCTLLINAAGSLQPNAHALMALMHFHFSRIKGRMDSHGVYLPLALQDRSEWDQDAIRKGVEHMALSATGTNLSAYHLEAGIACQHCLAPSFEETNWHGILELYDMLMAVEGNPIIALNCAVVKAFAGECETAIQEVLNLEHEPMLNGYPFYWAARGEVYAQAGEVKLAFASYTKAASMARNTAEKRAFTLRAEAVFSCRKPDT